jgi:hypothetical protein
MHYLQLYYFYRCYHCGEWYYTNKIIKTKKCVIDRCNRTFKFKNSAKFQKKCSQRDAIAIIKQLKEKNADKTLLKYVKNENKLFNKIELKK